MKNKDIRSQGKNIIKSTINERIVSGLVYLSLFTPIGLLIVAFYFYYGRNSKFMKFHAPQLGFLLLLSLIRLFAVVLTEKVTVPIYFRPTNPILIFFSLALNVLILILAVSAFVGKSYRITKIFDFLKNNP